jgi:hypothetical protein
MHHERMTDFFQADKAKQSLRAAWAFRRSFQNWSRRPLALMQRKASTFSAPGLPQNIPDCLHREPMTVSTLPLFSRLGLIGSINLLRRRLQQERH